MTRFIWGLTVTALAVMCATPFGFAAAPVPKDDGKVRKADAAQRARSKNNLKEILLAMHNYHDANARLPRDIVGKDGKPLLSWRVLLLPYLEETNLYEQFKLDEPWNSENNIKLLAKMPNVYRVGFEPKDEVRTYYQGFAGPGALFEPGKKLAITNITDGISNTLAVVEAGPPVEWTKPGDIAYDPKKDLPKLDGPFSNVLLAAAADGDIHALQPNIEAKSFRRLIEVADGEAVSPDDFHITFPLSPDELAAAEKMLAQNEKLLDEMFAEMKAHQKLLLEIAKQPNAKDAGKRFEEIAKMHKNLTETVEGMKKETQRLKEDLEKAKKEPAKPKQ